MSGMQSKEELTLGYYERHAQEFAAGTQAVDFSRMQDRFLALLGPGSLILDLGCGSGRDSRRFLGEGHRVLAVDASEELCQIASRHAGIAVTRATFLEYDPHCELDGIWACASLLHVPRLDLPRMLRRYLGFLRPGGIFYASFKYGDTEEVRGGRFFNDLNEAVLVPMIEGTDLARILSLEVTPDVRPDRAKERWLNCFMERSR